jgi:glycosyltransferase involved in cell wall biosynthesis
VSDYPAYSQKKVKSNTWQVCVNDKRIDIHEIPFINRGIFKLVTRFFSALYISIKQFRLKPQKAGVIVYSVHVPYMLVGLIVAKIFRLEYIAIWTDPPAVKTRKDFGMKSRLRKIEFGLSRFLMSRVTKVIALTKYLAEDFAPGKPYLVMEGIVDLNEIDNCAKYNNSLDREKTLKFVYTGSLERRYGVQNIVEGFLSMKSKGAVLEVYGRGDYEDELANIVSFNPAIKYGGFVKNAEVMKIQREADFLINVRSSEDDYVKYSFPSKTLEYLLSGTPLITTLLPGMPEDYRNYVIVLDNNNPKTIGKKFDEVMEYSKSKRDQIGIRAQEFVKTKDCVSQAVRIMNFIEVA